MRVGERHRLPGASGVDQIEPRCLALAKRLRRSPRPPPTLTIFTVSPQQRELNGQTPMSWGDVSGRFRIARKWLPLKWPIDRLWHFNRNHLSDFVTLSRNSLTSYFESQTEALADAGVERSARRAGKQVRQEVTLCFGCKQQKIWTIRPSARRGK